jgi:ubiquinone/menaquinone biosynthesis C-methylase UbiE
MNISTPREATQVLKGTSFGEEADNYSIGRKPYPKSLFQGIKKLVGRKAHILDMACGSGRVIIDLRAYVSPNVTGFDIDEKMLQKAKELAEKRNIKGITYIQGDARKIDADTFKSAPFDAITICSAIQWMLKANALPAIRSVLKPKGKLIIIGGRMGGKKESSSGHHKEYRAIVSRILNREITKERADGENELDKQGFTLVKTMEFPGKEVFTFAEACADLKSHSFFAELSDEEKKKVSPALEAKVKEMFTDGVNSTICKEKTQKCFVYEPTQPKAKQEEKE